MATGFDVPVAFWAKPTESGKWYLYLASPFVDDHGAKAAYLHVFDLLRKTLDLWIEPLDIKVIGLTDSLADAAMQLRNSMFANRVSPVSNPKFLQRMTRFDGSSLGGVSVDGAYIYPPRQPAA
ncbi:MAG TPA: hypothetical protein VGP68_00095 [Gemmataceae bacterium]|nr:hypothetical protein [Gemmataceae bacterium]